MEVKIEKNKPCMQLIVTDYLNLIKAKATPVSLASLTHKRLVQVQVENLDPSVNENSGIPEEISESIFSMGQSLAQSTVKENCWKYKEVVNQFYHNALACFVYLYLDSNQSPLEQIQSLKTELNQNQESVVQRLIAHCMNTLLSIQEHNQEAVRETVMVTNAANGKFLGGVSTYGKGSAEEALCRESDLFLRMLFKNANGDYQKRILMTLLTIFETMLISKGSPISHKTSSDALAIQMVNTITKNGFEGYCLYYHAEAQINRMHLNQNILVTNPKKLPSIEAIASGQNDAKIDFLNHCHIHIDVMSIAAKDNRLIGSNPWDFFSSNDANFRQLSRDILSLANQVSENQKRLVKLIILPLGCGAFGNKPSDFGQHFKWALKEVALNVSEINLATFEDNYQELANCFSELEQADFLFYENKGKWLNTINGVNVFAKLQNINQYAPKNKDKHNQDKALVVSVSTNRKELPSGLSLYSASALTSICNEIQTRGNELTIPAFEKEFYEGMRTEKQFFKSNAASELFARQMYIKPIHKKGADFGYDNLVQAYKSTLSNLSHDGILFVDLTLFGTSKLGYSPEESCQALLDALSQEPLIGLKEISIIMPNLTLMSQVTKKVSEFKQDLEKQTVDPGII